MGKGAGGPKRFHYFLGAHLAICRGPVDAVTEVRAGDKSAWTGTAGQNGTLRINQPDLFGGEDSEGGVVGDVDIRLGGADQQPDDYLVTQLGAPQPAYRGVLSLILRQVYVACNNPYLKPWAVRVKRLPAPGWYPEAAAIGDNANPAHILYELVTSDDWGMGYANQVDDAAFRAVADRLKTENFGLSFQWTAAEPVDHFVQEVLDHIAGALFVDPATGLFTLRLIRDDADVATLPVFDESNVLELSSYQRRTLSETVNQITVTYTRPDTGKDASVTVQDLANIQAQGAVVADSKSYPGIMDETLATRVATRDLVAAAALLANVRLTVNRDGATLRPGDSFVLNWPKLGLDQLVLTVGEIQGGTLTDGKIQISAVENVFALADENYMGVEPGGWVPPDNTPAPIANARLMEAPYRDLARRMSAADLDALAADAGHLQAMAVRPSGLSMNYELDTRIDPAAFGARDTASFVGSAVLNADIAPNDTAITIAAGIDLAGVKTGTAVLLDDEICRLDALDVAAGTATLGRGCADTVPAAHAAGARLYFYGDEAAVDATEYVDGETVDAKLLTVATGGKLALTDAPVLEATLASRQARPYPPGQVRINGMAYPDSLTGALAVAWAHRDRLTEADQLIDTEDGNIGPEAGTTYTLRIYGEAGALIHTEANINGTAFNWPVADEIAASGLGRPNESLTVELESDRDGLASRQLHHIGVAECRGYGMFYGAYYGD